MNAHRGKSLKREIKANFRDTFLLLNRFRVPLFLFAVMLLGSGTLYYFLSRAGGVPLSSPVEAVYLVLTMAFLQASGDFPKIWYLQVFFFVMPVLGIGILAQGLADFGVLLFNRRARGKEWEMAVASTFTNHVVLVGMGHLGFRVARKLYDMDQDVVVIDLDTKTDLLHHARELGIPVIQDDASREVILESSGIRKARAIILCTQNDNLNLQIAVKARSLNPEIKVIIRIFDDEFAQLLQKQFGFIALSATGMAAPVFAATAANINITPPISINGKPNSLASLTVHPKAKFCGKTINDLEDHYRVSVVMLNRNEEQQLHPAGDQVIQSGDILAVLGEPDQITCVVQANNGNTC